MTSVAQTVQTKPRVFLIIDSPVGAYFHYCAQLGNALVDTQSCAVRLVALFEDRKNPGVSEGELSLLGPGLEFEVLGPAGGSRLWRYWMFLKNLIRHVREVRRGRAGIVHIHTGIGWPVFDSGLLLLYRLLRVPIVRTVHELTAAERVRQPTRFDRMIGIMQVKLAHAVIAHDEFARDQLLSFMNGRSVTVVPHGNYLCFRSVAQVAEKPTGETRGALTVLFQGVKRHKGIEVFLEAMHQLLVTGVSVVAIVIGRVNAGDEDLLERIRGLPNVRLMAGYIANADIGGYYLQSDIVVLPYIKGTTSGAVHLAYAFKRAVISSDLPCFRDLVMDGHTGFVVPAGDVEALTGAILQAMAQRTALAQMGEAGFGVVSSARYAWAGIAIQTLEVYRQVQLRGKGRPIPTDYKAGVEDEDRSGRRDLAPSRTSLT